MITTQQTLTSLETKISTEKSLIMDYIQKLKNKQPPENIESKLDILKEIYKEIHQTVSIY